MGVQLFIAVFLVKVPFGRKIVSVASDAVSAVINCGQAGLDFVFGSLADSSVSGSIFIVQVLGNIIFLSALVSLLYYVGALGFVVKWIGKGVGRLMGTTEVESFVAVANMFLGIYSGRICSPWYSDGLFADCKFAGTSWKYSGCENGVAADGRSFKYFRS